MTDTTLHILAYPGNARGNKAIIAARFNGVSIDTPEGFSMKDGHHKTPSFLALNPFGQVPTLQTPEGGVFESNSVARYVARAGQDKYPLYGKNKYEESRIDGFLDVILGLDAAVGPWIYPLLGYGAKDEAKEKESKEKTKKIALGFERALEGKKYLVGDSITLADVVCATSWAQVATVCFDADYAADLPNLIRYLKETTSLPEFDVLRLNWAKVDAPAPKSECHFPGCKGCEKQYGNCGRCFKVKYCCADCQREDWPRHRSACKPDTTLYAVPLSAHCLTDLIFIKHFGLNVQVVQVNLMGGENKTPEFLKMNPNHSVPTLKDGDFAIWESNSILRYLASSRGLKSVYPDDPRTRAWIDAALDWRQTSLYPTVADATYPIYGWTNETEKIQPAIEKLGKHWTALRHFLAGKKFIGGESLSLADFAVGSAILYLGINSSVVLPADIKEYFDRFTAASKGFEEVTQILRDFQASKRQ